MRVVCGALGRRRLTSIPHRMRGQEGGDKPGIPSANRELVRVDDRERVEVQALKGKAHAVKREVVELTPLHCPRFRVHQHPRALWQRQAPAAAVVKEHDGIGIEELEVVEEVPHTIGRLVHQAGEDVHAARLLDLVRKVVPRSSLLVGPRAKTALDRKRRVDERRTPGPAGGRRR